MVNKEIIKITSNDYEDAIFEFSFTSKTEFDRVKSRINQGISDTTELELESLKTIDILNQEIDRLTNHADKTDYIFATCSGMVSGLIDSFFVGEFSLDGATQWGKGKVDSFVKWIAKGQGCKSDNLQGCVSFLENKFPIAGDSVTNQFGGGLYHHLHDFSHHPNVLGLCFSMLTQFTGKAYGTNSTGGFICVEVEDKTLIGQDFPRKISLGFISWFFHMVSDMAGSSSSISLGKYGTGLPGPFVSFVKMVSALPVFQNEEGRNILAHTVLRLFNGTLLGDRDTNGRLTGENIIKFDLRTELGGIKELGKQAIPVLINECLVRGFYFVRRLYVELKNNKAEYGSFAISKINWRNTLPFKNRTIVRMLTVAHGSFVAVDLIDAAARTAISGQYVDPVTFMARMALRVNFVGIGRFTIALCTDIKMGMQKRKKEREKCLEMTKYLLLRNANIHYHKSAMWVACKEYEESCVLLDMTVTETIPMIKESLIETGEIAASLPGLRNGINKNNPALLNDISHMLY